MAKTYEPIATTTLGSAAASYTFSSIPSTYTDLVLVVNSSTATNDASWLQFNGDTGSNYSNTRLQGNGSTATSDRGTSQTVGYYSGGDITNTNVLIAHIMNYSNTITYKTTLSRFNVAASSVNAEAILWRSTAAINAIKISNNAYNFTTGSTFTLYGIKAA
jgi:hypothetical protein